MSVFNLKSILKTNFEEKEENRRRREEEENIRSPALILQPLPVEMGGPLMV